MIVILKYKVNLCFSKLYNFSAHFKHKKENRQIRTKIMHIIIIIIIKDARTFVILKYKIFIKLIVIIRILKELITSKISILQLL